MGRFDSTKAAIDANIKKNDNQEITGSILNYVMNDMVNATEAQLEATDVRITEVSKDLESKADKSEVSIPDWDAAEDEAGYIKKRTHYKEAVEKTFVGIEKGDYILDAEGNPDGWESWVEAGGVEDESAKVILPVTIAFGLSNQSFELTFDHVGQREILEQEEYENSYASILEVGIDEKEGECYLHFTTRGCDSPRLDYGQEIDVRIESFKRLNDGYIPSTIVRKSDLEGLYAEIDSQNQLIEDLQNTKIDKEADDYYPQLSVGLADNLAGQDVVASEVSFRRSGGGAISDGAARIEAIKGNSVVWNQGIYNSNFAEGLLNWEASNTSLTINADGSIRATNETGDSQGIFQYVTMPCAANHKVLVIVDFQRSDLLQSNLVVYLRKQQGGYDTGKAQISSVKRVQVGLIIQTTDIILGVRIYPFSYGPVGSYCDIYGCYMYDLTKMFGAGKEPTTIEEFNARKPLGNDETAYNDGDVIHMDVQSLESVGVNQWDEEWETGTIKGDDGTLVDDSRKIRTKNLIRVLPNKEYNFTQPSQLPIRIFLYDADKVYKTFKYFAELTSFLIPSDIHYIKVVFEYATYSHDICINLFDAQVNGKYFPYVKRIQSLDIIRKYFPEGMKSAGSAHDEIRYNKATQKWEKVQRIGSVDMGSLNWSQYSVVGTFFTYSIKDYKKPTNNAERSDGLLCQHYVGSTNPFSASIDDKAWLRFESENTIVFRDSSYTDATSFKAAMQGVMLYYELAEPIVTEIEGDFNLDYEVWNGGTEEVISDVQTTPLKAEIAYGFNAIGKIKELESLVAVLRAKLGI